MTDNITPQAPQAKAPMTTEEIIDRLKQVSFTYARLTTDTLSSKEVARDKQALTAGIRAVTALEEVRRSMADRCITCKHNFNPPHTGERPCKTCTLGDTNWEWRWPLGGGADQ